MSTKSYSRRDFLKTAGIVLAASVVTCSGLGYAATYTPAVDPVTATYGESKNINRRILIAAATRAGSTIGVATAIGESLSQRGFLVEVKPLNDKPDVSGYQAVVIGSAIRTGNWLPEAVEFVKSNQQALQAVPAVLFSVHMNNLGQDETSRANRRAYLDSVRPLLPAAQEVYFAGKIDPDKLSFVERWIVKMVKSPIGDFRDWTKIKAWAETVTLF